MVYSDELIWILDQMLWSLRIIRSTRFFREGSVGRILAASFKRSLFRILSWTFFTILEIYISSLITVTVYLLLDFIYIQSILCSHVHTLCEVCFLNKIKLKVITFLRCESNFSLMSFLHCKNVFTKFSNYSVVFTENDYLNVTFLFLPIIMLYNRFKYRYL